jgi:hypothetical protein
MSLDVRRTIGQLEVRLSVPVFGKYEDRSLSQGPEDTTPQCGWLYECRSSIIEGWPRPTYRLRYCQNVLSRMIVFVNIKIESRQEFQTGVPKISTFPEGVKFCTLMIVLPYHRLTERNTRWIRKFSFIALSHWNERPSLMPLDAVRRQFVWFDQGVFHLIKVILVQ